MTDARSSRISWRTDEGAPEPSPEIRHDRGELLSAKRLDDGTLLVEGYAARPGVYVYRNADGSERRELVPRSTLIDFARTLGRNPVTLHHPDRTDGRKVTPDNYSKLSVGDVDGDVVIEDDGYVRVKLAVRRRDAIDAVEGDGTTELSPGYAVQLDETPGVDDEFGAYDAVQVKRWGNHLALVDNARGGSGCHIRVDGDPRASRDDHPPGPSGRPTTGAPMLTALVALLARHGMSVRTDSEEAALADLDTGLAALKQDRDNDKAAADTAAATLTADRDAEKKRADDAEAKVTELEGELQARDDAAELDRLAKVAAKVQVDAKGLDLPGLRLAIAKTQVGDADLTGKADAYLDALVDRADAAEVPTGRWEGKPTQRNDNDTKRADGGNKPIHASLGSTYSKRGDK